MLLMIDNYDSFTYNVVQYLASSGRRRGAAQRRHLSRRDRALAAGGDRHLARAVHAARSRHLGAVIQHFGGRLPILGVCLGHQAIGAALGGAIVRARRIMHGKTSPIHTTAGVFASSRTRSRRRATTRS
jgi:anthranilate synthase component 2